MKQLTSKDEKGIVVQKEMKPDFHALLSKDRHTVVCLDNGQVVEIMTDRDCIGVITIYSPASATLEEKPFND